MVSSTRTEPRSRGHTVLLVLVLAVAALAAVVAIVAHLLDGGVSGLNDTVLSLPFASDYGLIHREATRAGAPSVGYGFRGWDPPLTTCGEITDALASAGEAWSSTEPAGEEGCLLEFDVRHAGHAVTVLVQVTPDPGPGVSLVLVQARYG